MVNMEYNRLQELVKNYSIKEICEIENIPYSTAWYKLKKLNIKVLRKPKYKYLMFDEYTPESCYWAGFIAADGNVLIGKSEYRIAIKLQKDDLIHLKKFKIFVNSTNRIIVNNNICYTQIFSKHVFNVLKENFNIVPNKSLILKPPPNSLPRNMLNHYLRGYFDGDGHIGYNGYSTYCNFNVVCGSKHFINWFSDILKSFDLVLINHIYKKNNCFCIDINNQNSLKIFDWMYNNSNQNIRLDRKYKTYCDCKTIIQSVLRKYSNLGKRPPSGCKGFDLNYKAIGKQYLSGKTLKDLAKQYNVSVWTLLDNFKKLNIRKTIKRTVNSEAFSTFTQESCYWAGFITADGWVTNYRLGIELSTEDKSHLINLCSFLQSNAKINDRERISNGKIYKYSSVLFSSKDLVCKLNYIYGICSRKSLVLKAPKNLPNEFIKDYIRGYMDGDGSIGWHKNNNTPRICFTSGTKEMLEWIKKSIKSVITSSGNPSVLKFRKSNTYVLEFIGKQTYDIANWLYKDANIYLNRKYERYCLWFIPTQEVL